jgi:phospholipase/carboxylesterase
VVHGTADTVLPVDRCGRVVARTLRTAGLSVHYEEFEGRHVITPELVDAGLGWWLAAT